MDTTSDSHMSNSLSILLMLGMIFSEGSSVDALRLAARLILRQNTSRCQGGEGSDKEWRMKGCRVGKSRERKTEWGERQIKKDRNGMEGRKFHTAENKMFKML